MKKGSRSNVVYEITCPKCWASYIGMSERHICKHITEHFQAGDTLSIHMEECGIVFKGLEHTSVIDSTSKGIIHLSILEALYNREKSFDEYERRI